MVRQLFPFFFTLLIGARTVPHASAAIDTIEEHALVAMRMIGHELLLASGDSTSRVLPVIKEKGRYKIQFESSLSFVPDELALITDSVMYKNQLAAAYLVEVVTCDSNEVVYSFKKDTRRPGDFMPCKGRLQPKGCYVVWVRIIAPMQHINPWETLDTKTTNQAAKKNTWATLVPELLIYALIGFVLSFLVVLQMKRKTSKRRKHLIDIGSYLFDHKNMALLKGDEKQELTGKETDLLRLLYNHLNDTVNRDIILREVWSDEGVYVGRTLDVYISKLRKKFEADPAVSIINVRGVGYKLTLN